MSNTYEKIPSNPPKKVIKKKVQLVYDDYDNENDALMIMKKILEILNKNY